MPAYEGFRIATRSAPNQNQLPQVLSLTHTTTGTGSGLRKGRSAPWYQGSSRAGTAMGPWQHGLHVHAAPAAWKRLDPSRRCPGTYLPCAPRWQIHGQPSPLSGTLRVSPCSCKGNSIPFPSSRSQHCSCHSLISATVGAWRLPLAVARWVLLLHSCRLVLLAGRSSHMPVACLL